MKRYSQLTIILSNCLSGGTGWNTISSQLIENLYKEMASIEGLEFKLINSNTVRGEHNGFTLIVGGVFYNLQTKQSNETASNLLEYTRNAVNRISDLTYSEVRVEHTRHLTAFNKV